MSRGLEEGMGSKFWRRGIIYLVVIAALVALFFAFFPRSPEVEQVSLSQLVEMAEEGVYNDPVERVVVSGEVLTAYLVDDEILFSSIDPETDANELFSPYRVEIVSALKGLIFEEGILSEMITQKAEDGEVKMVVVSGEVLTAYLAGGEILFSPIYTDKDIDELFGPYDIEPLAASAATLSTISDMARDGIIKNHNIESIELSGEALTVYLTNGKTVASSIPESIDAYSLFSSYGVEYKYIPPSGFNWGNLLMTLLPLLLFVGFIWFIFSRARGAGNQAMSFGRSKARLFPSSNPTVTFDDVAGVEEAKQELQEVVEFLKTPERFTALGARIPRGVLLVGPPGTGKTLLARAVAGEAGAPFFSISGSEFVEMFVGVGASRVRDLFDQAKRNSPCIVFIDEIDAVGRHRGAGFGGGHDEREQTLNQILVEMDGFDSATNVIVLSATNRPDILDPALLRPGRFDRQVVLDRPDIKGRKAILEVHAKGMPLDDSVNLEIVAKQTPGFSGADLASLVNEAAILAARRDKKEIGLLELEESIDRVIAGPERKSRIISPREKEITAYHEAGHALVARTLPHADPVHKVSIIARGMMGGYTRLLPTEDRYMWTRSQFNDMLATMLAGHAAEDMIFGEMTTGPESDIEQATKIARRMVTEYGMSEKLGPRTFGRREELVFLGREVAEQKDYSEKTAEEIDEEVHSIIQNAYSAAKGVLTENRAKLVQLAEALIANETIEGEDLEALFNKPVEEVATAEAPEG